MPRTCPHVSSHFTDFRSSGRFFSPGFPWTPFPRFPSSLKKPYLLSDVCHQLGSLPTRVSMEIPSPLASPTPSWAPVFSHASDTTGGHHVFG